jgi:peptide/nickel transport system substrate-binding protein
VSLACPEARAGGRARAGGTLAVGVVARSLEADPLLADAPADAAALLLSATPLCRLAELTRPTPGTLRLTLPPAVPPALAAAALRRVAAATSPYRAMLAGVSRVAEVGRAVEVSPAPPDLERALCHPAFALRVGPFRGEAGALTAALDFPEGRPWVDAVALTVAEARTADRLLAQHRLQVVLGSAQADETPQLFVLTLVLPAALAPHLRQALDATVDRADLVRFFLRAPAAPLPGLLPPALGGPTALPARGVRPPPRAPTTAVTVLYEAEADEQRAIAERLQVKLQPLGYRVALKGLPRHELEARAPGEGELKLAALLLPPSPTGALAVLAEAAGQGDRVPALQQALAAAPDVDARARELALALGPELLLWPVATRGLGVTVAHDVQHLTRDALGLPRLDDAFLSGE